MEITTRIVGGIDVLEVSGPATVDGHEWLRERFYVSIHRGRTQFIQNLIHAVSLDSMMLAELVACLKRARERGGDLKLVVSPDGIAHELLQLTGLDQIVQIYGDEGEAAASFANDPS